MTVNFWEGLDMGELVSTAGNFNITNAARRDSITTFSVTPTQKKNHYFGFTLSDIDSRCEAITVTVYFWKTY